MRNTLIFLGLSSVVGCATAGAQPASATPKDAALASSPGASSGASRGGDRDDGKATGAWIGAAPEGDLLASGTTDTFLGVWVDVPGRRPETRPPMEVALVVDTSGSMAGAKIENARAAATELVKSLKDGDIVALDAFSDHARTIIPPTRLDRSARVELAQQIALLTPSGSTNMFEGLSLAEGQMQAAPATHTVRRIVMISDGIANVGPSSPETLGAVAERGLRFRAQVTSLGVGADYDERTLDALSLRSSGRLFHIANPEEMAKILRDEVDLLDGTVASDAFMEIVPAPGVTILGADGARSSFDAATSALRIPLGTLHAGQHREALVRVRLADPSAFEGHTRSVASVRLRFRDAQEGDLERIQEVVARTALTNDGAAVAAAESPRTKAIAAIMESSKLQIDAAQRINDGNFVDADKELERAHRTLTAQAASVKAPVEKKRLEEAAGRVAAARAAAPPAAAPAMSKPAQMDHAKRINAGAMHDMGL